MSKSLLSIVLIIILSTTSFFAQCDTWEITADIQQKKDISELCATAILLPSAEDVEKQESTIIKWSSDIKKSSSNEQQKRDYFNQIILICKNDAATKSVVPMVFYELGKWLYINVDDNAGAIKAFSSAVEIMQMQTNPDSIFLSKCLTGLGSAYFHVGDINSCEKIIKHLLDEKWPSSPKSLAGNLKILGLIYRKKGNIPLAEEYFYQSGIKYASVYDDSLHFVDHGLNSIGLLYYEYSYYEQAITTFQLALQILFRLGNESKKGRYLKNKIHNNLANTYTRTLEFNKSLIEYEEILKIYQESGSKFEIIRTLLNIGVVYSTKNDIRSAERYYHRADSLLKLYEDPRQRALLLDNQAQLFRIKGDFSPSLKIRKNQLLNNCNINFIDLFDKSWKDINTETLLDLRKILPKISIIYRDQYRKQYDAADLDSAMLIFNITQSILDQIKLNQLDPDFSADLGALNADLLEDVLSLYEDKPDWTDRYYTFFEKAKSASLLASIQSSDTESLFRKRYPEIKKVHQIKLAIDSIQDLLENTEDATIADKYRTGVLQLSQKLVKANEAKQKLLVSQNELTDLYDHVELDVLQNSLDDESCMLSYFINQSKDELFILYITNSEIELFSKKVYGQFTEDVFRLVNMPTKTDIERSAWIKSNNRISELLLGDVLPKTSNRLNIIPDGILAYLPFEMLLTKTVETTESYAALPYLIKDKSISYNFSASIWKEMSDKKTTGKGLLTMAPEFSMLDGIGNANNQSTIPLGHAKKEVAAINSLFNSKYQPTTKSEFIDQTAQAQIVHFAGHAILNDNKPDNSYLAFSSSDDREDKLFIRDIYNMRTPNELVVLSACNTGQGELKKGEGVMSMARAFAYSGAKSLVYSLWDVNDGSTKKIMEHFYQELKAGATKDQALRTAKLTYLDQAKGARLQPFYWAGFVAMGDMAPIDIGVSYWIYALGLFLGLGVLVFLYRRLT